MPRAARSSSSARTKDNVDAQEDAPYIILEASYDMVSDYIGTTPLGKLFGRHLRPSKRFRKAASLLQQSLKDTQSYFPQMSEEDKQSYITACQFARQARDEYDDKATFLQRYLAAQGFLLKAKHATFLGQTYSDRVKEHELLSRMIPLVSMRMPCPSADFRDRTASLQLFESAEGDSGDIGVLTLTSLDGSTVNCVFDVDACDTPNASTDRLLSPS